MISRFSLPVRIIVDIALAVSVAHGWWQAALVLGLAGSVFCRNFIEIIIAGLAYDALFHPTIDSAVVDHAAALSGACMYAASAIVRASIRRRI